VTTRREMLAGADQRRAEPLREDRPDDVRARLTPLLGEPAVSAAVDAWHAACHDGMTTLEAMRRVVAELDRDCRALVDTARRAGQEQLAGQLAADQRGTLHAAVTRTLDETADEPGHVRAMAVTDAVESLVAEAAGQARADCAADLRPLLDQLAVAVPAGCPSDPCPVCTALEAVQSLIVRWEG